MKHKVIAHVPGRRAPDNLKTVGDWIEWRAKEDERVFDELFQQLVAHFERQLAGKLLH